MRSPTAARKSIAQAEGSGTGVKGRGSASGPPGSGAMVTVEPVPMVSVPWAMELAVNWP